MVENIYTGNGWEDIDTDSLEGVTCCDCPEPAAQITENGAPDILWAQCEGCAGLSRADTIDAKRQAEYDCEY